MALISSMTVLVSYDILDDRARASLRAYLTDVLGAEQRGESVYEFIYRPPPQFLSIIQALKTFVDDETGDEIYVWDLEKGRLRRLALHDG